MPTQKLSELPAYWLALLIAIQAIFFSIFVTPLADIPDESGHFAYVTDISKGRPLPVLGNVENNRGIISNNLWKNWGNDNGRRVNYIIQHPPLYYAVAAIPYSIATQLTDNKFIHAHAARLISAFSLGLLVLVIFKGLRHLQVDSSLALMVSAWFSMIPMVMHLASGITNDIFLTLMCALSTLYLIKFLTTEQLKYAYICAFWLACAAATKMTAWVLIAGFVAIIVFELKVKPKKWIMHSFLIGLISTIPALWWMRRNYFFFKNPFYVYGSDVKTAPKLPDYTAMEFLQNQPFFDWIFHHTYGLWGFSGYCLSAPNVEILIQHCKGAKMTSIASGPSFWIGISTFIGIAVLLVFKLAEPHNGPPPLSAKKALSLQELIAFLAGKIPFFHKFGVGLFISLGFIASIAFAFMGYKIHPETSWPIYIFFATMLLASVISIYVILNNQTHSINDRIIAYGVLLIVWFCIMMFKKSLWAYSLDERLSGIQGRYLFPYYPLVIISVGYALQSLKHRLLISFVITTGLVWALLNAYTNVYLPFSNGVRL